MQTKPQTPASDGDNLPLKRKGNRTYLAIWALLGCTAAAYLVVVALGGALPGASSAQWNNASGDGTTVTLRQSSVTPNSYPDDAQWNRVNREIEDLKGKVTTVIQDLTTLEAHQGQTRQRVTNLESWKSVVVRNNGGDEEIIRTGSTTTTTDTDDSANSEIEGTTLDGVTHTTPARKPAQAPSGPEDAAVLAALLSGDPEAAIAAGIAPATPPSATPEPGQVVEASLKPEPAVEPNPLPAVVPLPGQRTYGVELGSGDSVDSLRLTWALLNERHRELIGSLAPRYVKTGSGAAELYRLIAGPFTSNARARELCTQLQAYYVTCQTSAFTGQVL